MVALVEDPIFETLFYAISVTSLHTRKPFTTFMPKRESNINCKIFRTKLSQIVTHHNHEYVFFFEWTKRKLRGMNISKQERVKINKHSTKHV